MVFQNDFYQLARQRSSNIQFGATDERILNLITKYLVLIIMVNISTIVLLIYWTLEITLGLPFFAQTFLSFDNLINMLSLYLQFVFGNQLYKKFCSMCHKCTKSKMTRWTINTVVRETDRGVVNDKTTTLQSVASEESSRRIVTIQ